ncbi:MAG: hypothetical protein OXK21_08255 [Chloroflexota bacterium]|nr:hypothetical protein [Chloroflexota bacterium]
MTTTPQDARIGEVVEAASTGFTAECYALYGASPLGALVRVGDPAVYGVVYSVTTAALDPGRRVAARGADEPDEASVYRNNPQIARLLATHLQALVVGHERGGAVVHRLPAAPPRIHAFVRCCNNAETRAFTEDLGFLHLLTTANVPAIDEVIAASIRLAAEARSDADTFRERAARALAEELSGDVPRLNAILRGIR